jgi:putative ABC transport system permease protein
MILDLFKLSLKNIKKRKLRSGLTMIGIIVSIATIFVLISLSLGLKASITEQVRLLGSDKFFIMPRGQLGAPGTGGAVQLTLEDIDVIEKVRGIKQVSYIVVGNAKVEYKSETKYFMVAGLPLDNIDLYIETGAFKADEGKLLKQGNIGKIMVGSDYKYNNVFKKSVKTGDKFIINGKEFQIIGIIAPIGNPQDDKNIYMSFEDFKLLFNSGDRVDQIIAQVQAGEDVKQIADLTSRRLMKFRDVTEKTKDFDISTPEELLASFSVILNVITAFLAGVAGISLVVGAIGISNTMYTSVLERTKEIGTMKAIGAKNSSILTIFLIESGLLGLVGGIIGVSLGIGLAKFAEFIAINFLNTTLLRASLNIWLILGSLAFAFLIGTFSGLLPAKQASELQAAESLRYE